MFDLLVKIKIEDPLIRNVFVLGNFKTIRVIEIYVPFFLLRFSLLFTSNVLMKILLKK